MNHSVQNPDNSPQGDPVAWRDRQILDTLPAGALLTRINDGVILYANRAVGKLLGVEDLSAVMGAPVPNFYWDPDERQIVLARFRAQGSLSDYELRIRRTDGSMLWVAISIELFDFLGEKVLLSTILDITAKKDVEQRFLESEKRLATLFDALPLPVIVTQVADGKVLYANQQLGQLVGMPLEKMLGSQTPDFYYRAADRQRFVEILQKEGRVRNAEIQIKKQDGTPVWVEITIELTTYDDKPATVAIIEDITGRRQAEAEIREHQERLQSVTTNVPGVVYQFYALPGGEMGVTYVSERAADIFDLEADLPTFFTRFFAGVHPDDQPGFMSSIQTAVATASPWQYEGRFVKPSGEVVWFTGASTPVQLADRIVFNGLMLDVTDRKQAEADLQASLERFHTLFETANDAIHLIDEGKFIDCNLRAVEMFGYDSKEDILQHSPLDFSPAIQPDGTSSLERAEGYIRAALSGTPQKFYWRHNHRDGSPIDAEISLNRFAIGDKVYLQAIERDITDRIRLEEQARILFERRGGQVELSTQVAQEIAAATDLQSLYQRVVAQVKERFGYYHVQILRFDPAVNAVVLVTGYGEIGAKMLAGGHRLAMGVGLIGTAAATERTVLRPDLATGDPDWKPNPLLPATRGEIAVPIKWQNKVLGVLDVQSAEVGALGADDQLLLEGLCGQIAIAIEQTRLREEMQDRLAEINALYRSMSREGWKSFSQLEEIPDGFLFEQGAVHPVPAEDEALKQAFISAPLTIPGGVTVGALAIDGDPDHPLSPEDESFLQQISEQVALALESARLFAQTQFTLAETEDLYQASAELNTAKAYTDVLEAVRRNTILGEGSQNISLNLFDIPWTAEKEPEWIDVAARWSILPTGAVMDHYPFSAFPSIHTLLHPDTPTLIEDVEHDPQMDANARALYAQRFGARSTIFAPLVVSGQWIGYMNAIYRQPATFSENDVRRLMALAAQAAVVVNNQRLLEETRARVRREQILRQVTTQVRASVDADTILRTAVRELGNALGRETFIHLGGAAGQTPAAPAPHSPQPVDAEGGK